MLARAAAGINLELIAPVSAEHFVVPVDLVAVDFIDIVTAGGAVHGPLGAPEKVRQGGVTVLVELV